MGSIRGPFKDTNDLLYHLGIAPGRNSLTEINVILQARANVPAHYGGNGAEIEFVVSNGQGRPNEFVATAKGHQEGTFLIA